MNINQATATELNLFFANFFIEKDLDKSSFLVETVNYGQSDMPFDVLVDALTHPDQNINFLREVATIISTLDFNNAPQSEFRKFFLFIANSLAKLT
jgi:hypothetical protein